MKLIKILGVAIFLLSSFHCSVRETDFLDENKENLEVVQQPVNLIFFLGDGMGVNHLKAASLEYHGEVGQLNMEQMPVSSMVNTSAANRTKITDSAAGATALSTGHKTFNRMVGMTPDGVSKKTILEALKSKGYATGIITTSEITDASPAAFYAHVEHRYNDDMLIAKQLSNAGVDLIIGAPGTLYDKKGRPTDNINYMKDLGYDVITNASQLETHGEGLLLALFDGWGAEQTDLDVFNDPKYPDLKTCVEKAITILSRNKKGFFLFVEDEGIDTGSHKNLDGFTINRVKHLDDAVASALSFAQEEAHTLVIVTADHETGGLDAIELPGSKVSIKWTSGRHTPQAVPFFAFGTGSELFSNNMDNTEVPETIAKALEIEGFPQP